MDLAIDEGRLSDWDNLNVEHQHAGCDGPLYEEGAPLDPCSQGLGYVEACS
jgi:hypothetical protein